MVSKYSADESCVLSFTEKENGYKVTYLFVDEDDDFVEGPEELEARRTVVPRLFRYEETETGYRIVHSLQRRLGGEEDLELLPEATTADAKEKCRQYAEAYARDGDLNDVYEQIKDTDTQSVNLLDGEK